MQENFGLIFSYPNEALLWTAFWATEVAHLRRSHAQSPQSEKATGQEPPSQAGTLCVLLLRSCQPFTGVLFGEAPKVLRRVLSECFFGDSQKVPRRVPPRVPGKIGSAPGSAPRSAFLWKRMRRGTPGSTPWGTPNFPGTLRGTFWESPKSTLKALAGALSGLPQKALL